MESAWNVFDRVRQAKGEVLPAKAYQATLSEDYAVAAEFWKLERAQNFFEPDMASWRALMDGRWAESIALLTEMGQELTRFYRSHAPLRRVRIVERPLTPYLQWEMHALAVRAMAGEHPRVLAVGEVSRFERVAPLPELVVLGPSLMYEVLYDDVGAHLGGRRITDPHLIRPCLAAIRDLYARAEDLLPWFDREIVPMAPPVISARHRHLLPDYSHHTGTYRA